jgi:AcrR family transcriptional regulator
MTRYPPDRRERSRAAILEGAARMVRARGFEGASVGEVMRAAGLTHGGFYAHFEDKTALLAEAVATAFAERMPDFASLTAAAADRGDPGLLARAYLSGPRVAEIAGGCPAAPLMAEVPRQAPPVRAAFEHGCAEMAGHLSAVPGLEGPRAWGALAALLGAVALLRAMRDEAAQAQLRAGVEALLAATQPGGGSGSGAESHSGRSR